MPHSSTMPIEVASEQSAGRADARGERRRRATDDVPLCVDLDGTLVATDTLYESLLVLLKRRPWIALYLPFWLLRGRPAFKRRLTQHAPPDPASLPYRQEFLEWLRGQKTSGRKLYLVTGSDQAVANAVGEYLTPLFDGVWGSDGACNLAGANKRRRLVELFGEHGFDYAGNAPADVKVWRSARHAVIVGAPASLAAQEAQEFGQTRLCPAEPIRLRTVGEALRVRQWTKNVLVITVLCSANRLLETRFWLLIWIAFCALSLCASSIYIINDLLDLDADRRHPHKRNRPFASGRLPLGFGVALAPVLLAAAFLLGWWLPPQARLFLAVYTLVALLYSLFLKRKLLADVFILSLLYTVRVLLGAAATGVLCSEWLMGFCTFFFLSLAFSKRASELVDLEQRRATSAPGRNYSVCDITVIEGSGVASCFTAGIILAIYIQSEQVRLLYREPQWLWVLSIGVVYWLVRIWLVAARGRLREDPLVFAIHDRLSYVFGLIAVAVVVLARTGWWRVPGIQ